MEHMPRLHPDDLAELGKIISEELKPVLQKVNSKEEILKDMMTFNVREAATILNKDPDTIYRWCRTGVIKASKYGREWNITQQSLTEFRNGNTK